MLNDLEYALLPFLSANFADGLLFSERSVSRTSYRSRTCPVPSYVTHRIASSIAYCIPLHRLLLFMHFLCHCSIENRQPKEISGQYKQPDLV
jgi:hypothetical protein